MSPISNPDPRLSNLLIAALKSSLKQAEEAVKKAQSDYNTAEAALNATKADYDGYAQLVRDNTHGNPAPELPESPVERRHPLHPQKRLGTRFRSPRNSGVDVVTLDLVVNGNVFKTMDEVVNEALGYFDGQIKAKTVKNALWQNSSDEKLIKFYSKEHKGYVYGVPAWFDENNNPKLEHLKLPQRETTNADSKLDL